jgi:uncharacterized protein (TIGR03118 family)
MRVARLVLGSAACVAVSLAGSPPVLANGHGGGHGGGRGSSGHAAGKQAGGKAAKSKETSFQAHGLVSNGPPTADKTDTNLVNAWGIAFTKGAIRITANGTGLSTAYTRSGMGRSPTIQIPDGAPTGIVAKGASAFTVTSGTKSGRSALLFASESGDITGWSPKIDPKSAVVAFKTADGAIYKGLAVAKAQGQPFLYATDFHNAKVDVFDKSLKPVKSTGFIDPNLPAGFAPFGIATLGAKVYVTYAKQDAAKEDDVPGAGLGFVDAFNAQGHLIGRVASQGTLNAPWGLTVAPGRFGPLGGDLLVGNFGDGTISAFSLKTGMSAGQLQEANGTPLAIDGLWGIGAGQGGGMGSGGSLFFAAGPDDESNGLFGRIDPVSAGQAGSRPTSSSPMRSAAE